MSSWHLAPSLNTLRDQVDKHYPNRSKTDDGTIGDSAHMSRSSKHNVDSHGTVRALDLTHDPESGFNSYAFAEMLRLKRDPRIANVISNHSIFSSTKSPWVWRRYNGANAHDRHVHIDVKDDPEVYNNFVPWDISSMPTDAPELPEVIPFPKAKPEPVLRMRSSGDAVKRMQTLLRSHNINVKVDGSFGARTKMALKQFQAKAGLSDIDGICGSQTWTALKKPAV